jgi:glycosyltransferase involved in cell wall biosynthesis
MEPMRILFSYSTRLDNLGGSQLFVALLAEALLMRGHRVGIVEMTSIPSVQIARRFGGRVWAVPEVYPPRHPWSWRGFLRSTYHFQRIIRTFKPDIVSVQCPARQSISVIGAHALPHNWRLVVTAHAEMDAADYRWLQNWVRRVLKRADAVTAVSETLLHDLIALYPFVRHRGRTIHPGIDPSWFAEPSEAQSLANERYILYVGRLDLPKGVDILLQAWRQIYTRAPGIALCLVGDGVERDNLRVLSERLGIASHVRFMGRLDPKELPALYRGADLVVMASRRHTEGLPLVLLEASASGAVCVATRVAGVPEVIEDGVTGFLVEPEAPDALADALLRGLQLPIVERRAMGTVAKRRVAEHFSHERTVAGFEGLFRSLLARPKAVSLR